MSSRFGKHFTDGFTHGLWIGESPRVVLVSLSRRPSSLSDSGYTSGNFPHVMPRFGNCLTHVKQVMSSFIGNDDNSRGKKNAPQEEL